MKQNLRVAIIGGGAAGFFSALSAKNHFPDAEVTIYEKSAKVLAKVKVSGGGRCNVTHACFDNRTLSKFYPRGENQLRKAFEIFNAQSTVDWFAERNVPLVTLPDNCIFPKSDDSQTIIDCFENEASKLGVHVKIQSPLAEIRQLDNGTFSMKLGEQTIFADKIIIATGGTPKRSGLDWLEKLGCKIIDPLPSLFTFNMPNEPIKSLMGIVVENAVVKVESTKLLAQGPLLITHWGMSGPAILKLSAWGARILAEKTYNFAVLVNWLGEVKEDQLRKDFDQTIALHGAKMIGNLNPFVFPNRLWNYLLEKSSINPELRWKEIGKKNANRLINTLLNDRYEVSGKTTFKEEFVTAGGVALDQIDFKTMEHRDVKGLHFAGEILDIDGVTGGFNFQAAWTTGWIAGKSIGNLE
jgi:predicted Rossmann fold flavoprotein